MTTHQCERCAGTGITGHRARTGTYVGPGPVPEDARGFVEATCNECRGSGTEERTVTNEQLADHIAALDWSGTSLQHQLAMSAAVAVLRGRLEEPPENPVGACQEPLANPIGDLADLLAQCVNRC